MSEKHKDPKSEAAGAQTEEVAEHGKKHHDADEKHHSHGDKPHAPDEKAHAPGEKAHAHGEKAHAHGEKAHAHGEKAASHDQKVHQSQADKIREENDTKIRWSESRCRKAAGRFESVDEWQVGAPSSYKAAVAKGWVAACSTHMKTKKTNVVAHSKVEKVAPPKKTKKSA